MGTLPPVHGQQEVESWLTIRRHHSLKKLGVTTATWPSSSTHREGFLELLVRDNEGREGGLGLGKTAGLGECAFEVGEQVFDVFDAHRQA